MTIIQRIARAQGRRRPSFHDNVASLWIGLFDEHGRQISLTYRLDQRAWEPATRGAMYYPLTVDLGPATACSQRPAWRITTASGATLFAFSYGCPIHAGEVASLPDGFILPAAFVG